MKRILALFFIIIVLFVSCNKEKHQMFSLRKDFIDAIESYVRNDTNCERHDSYIIIPSENLYTTDIVPKGYLIGPYYKDIFGKKKHEIAKLIEVNAKNIYVDVSKMPIDTIRKDDIHYCSEDSILMCTIDGIPLYYSHEQIVNYLKRAHLLYYIDSHLIINEKADTFYLPKLIKSIKLPSNIN